MSHKTEKINIYDFNYNADGLRSASSIYFSKKPKDLTISESAMLVGMLKNSSLFNPLRRPERVEKRRNITIELEDFGDHALRFKVYFWAKQTWEIINIKSNTKTTKISSSNNNLRNIPTIPNFIKRIIKFLFTFSFIIFSIITNYLPC